MGQPLSEFLKKQDSTKKYAASVEKAELIIGTVSQTYGYYKLAKEIGEALGLWGGGDNQLDALADALNELEEAIKTSFAEVKQLEHAEFRLQTEQTLQMVLGPARTAVDTLEGHWNDPDEWNKDTLFFATQNAMEVLTGGAWWQRTFYKEVAYQDPWTGVAVPPDIAPPNGALPEPGTYQFDYMLALPAFLEALSNRVAVLRILDAEDIPTDHRKELEGYVTKLRETYEIIVGGIWTLQKPTRDEVMFQQSYPVDHFGHMEFFLAPSQWEQAMIQGEVGSYGPRSRLYGAFEVWSTVSSVESYPTQPPEPWWPGAQPNALYARWIGDRDQVKELRVAVDAWYDKEIERLHGLRSLRHRKHVYGSLSLRAIWNTRNDLLVLLGEPPESPPGLTDLWSLRDAVDAIPAEVRPSYSLRTVTSFCNTDHSLGALQGV